MDGLVPPAWMEEIPPLVELEEYCGYEPLPERASPRVPSSTQGQRPVLDPRDPMPAARALLVSTYMRDTLRTLHHYRGSFYEWNGSSYREIDGDTVQARVWAYLENARRYGKEGELIDFQPNRTAVENVVAALKAICNLPSYHEAPVWLSEREAAPARDLLPVRNGLLHLPSGKLHKPSPAFFCLNSADVEFDPHAPAPAEWSAFLDQIWPGDAQSIETLQDMFGYFLSPDTSQQKIALVVGPKRSGKGTIARVLTGLLGQENVAAPTLASLSTNFGLAPLIGKSLAIIGDARLSGRADQAAIAERLLAISGEDSVEVDRKYRQAWTGRLGVRVLVMSNELPRLADASGALASRFLTLVMEQSFYGKEDRGLGHRLLAEMPGILNWAREGYLRLQKRGYFLQPDSARDAIEELEELGSPISAFLKQECAIGTGNRTAADDLFRAWQAWCEANGRREPGTVQSFGRDIRAAVPGVRVTQPRLGGERLRYYEGLRLTDPGTPF